MRRIASNGASTSGSSRATGQVWDARHVSGRSARQDRAACSEGDSQIHEEVGDPPQPGGKGGPRTACRPARPNTTKPRAPRRASWRRRPADEAPDVRAGWRRHRHRGGLRIERVRTRSFDGIAGGQEGVSEAVFKAAEEYRQERSLEVNVTDATENQGEEAGEISNPNDEIPVTYLFYELQRRYRVSEHLRRVTPVVLVAQEMPKPSDIDDVSGWYLPSAGM